MSTLSGLATKGEKGKSKFQSLDINSLYRGESLEPAQKTILRKHGMQSLGRVPCARRAPANLPSLKAETSGADPPVSLVPSGGTGWGSKPSGEGANASATPASTPAQGPVAAAALLPPATLPLSSNTTQPTSQTPLPQSRQQPIPGPVGTAAASQGLATVATSGQSQQPSPLVGGPVSGGSLGHPLPLVAQLPLQEFPKLSGGSETDSSIPNAASGASSVSGVSQLTCTKGGSAPGVDVQYGPGPSLRPQSMVGDGLGARGAALGALPGGPSTPLVQTQGVGAGGGGTVPQGVGGTAPTPSAGVGAAAGGGGSGGAGTPFPGIMPRFLYRGGFPGPGGFPPNFQASLHGGAPRPQRFGYPSSASGPGAVAATEGEGGPGGRFGPAAGGRPPGPPSVGQGGQGGPVVPPPEDEVFQRPIIKEEDLNKMDDIVRGNGWATQDDIDYNQKLAFSDDESTEDDGTAGQSLRKEAGASASSSNSQPQQQGGGGRALNQNLSGSQHHHPIPLLQQSQNPPLHMHLKGKEPEGRRSAGPLGRGGAVPEDERDGLDLGHRDDVRGRVDDRSRDPKRLDGTRLVDGRGGWGQPGSRSGAPPPLMPPSMMEYRGGPRGSGSMGVASSQQGPASVPPTSLGNLMQGPFKMASHMPFGAASGRLVDDEEVWRERRRQTTEEVQIAVVRAKQRKEEEEKKFEESKQAAAKKLHNLEEKMGVNKEKKESQVQQQHHQAEEASPEWERDRSRTSSEGREEKGVAPAPSVARETLREIPRDSPVEREFRPAPPLMGSDRGGSGFSRDRDRDRELRGERDRDRHDYKFSRQFQSNLPPRFQRQQQQAEQQHLPALRGPPSPPPSNSRPRPASGPTPPGGTQASLTPSPPSVTSSEPATPAEGRGSSLTHESRWGSLGSSQPPLHYSAQGIAGMKSGSGPGRRGVRDEPIPATDRERERDREAERDREDRSVCMERSRVSGPSSEATRASTNSVPLDIRDKERTSEPKRVIPTSEDRDRRTDDRYRHGRDVRSSTMQGGYLENGRRGYYDGPDYGRGYGRGPPQDYDFDRTRGERDHSGDADPPRFSDSRHGPLPQNREFDPWERERDKEGRIPDKERIPDRRDRPLEKERERVIDRERLNDRERPVDRERAADRDRGERDGVLDRDRDRERGADRDRERERIVDRDGRRVDRVSERDDRIDRDRAQERDRPCERDRLSDRERLTDRERLERLDRERGPDRPERVSRGPGDRERPNDRDRNGERERAADRDRPVERDRPSDRERTGERDRPSERDRPGDRDRPTDRERPGDRDRPTERERPLDRDRPGDRDRTADRDRPGDRERPVDRDRVGDRDRIAERERTGDRDRQVERERTGDRDRQGDRGFEGDIRGADRERSVADRERNHERGPNERERGLQERVVSRERLVGRDRGDVERERERTLEVERTFDRERSGDSDRSGRPGERGLDRVGGREAEYRDLRRFDDRRGGDPADNKKVGSGELYPERRGPPQQQDTFEPEIDSRQVGLEWRESKDWKEERRSGALLGDERRQGSEDRPQRPDSRDERTGRDGRRETNRESKNGQLAELSGEVSGKGPPGNGGRRGDFVTSTSWADAPVEPLYPDVPEEKKEEYFRNEHRPLMDNSSSVDRKGMGESGVVGEGAWGFPRGGPPSACAQGHAPRGPGAEQAGVAGVAAGAPPTRGPPNRHSPSPPPPTTTTTPIPSGEGPPSPGRLPRAGPLPLGANSTAPPPPLLPPPRPQRQLSNTTTPTTPVGETTTWADEPAIAVDLMPPQEERLAREMLPSVGEGITTMDGKGPVNDKIKADGLEEKDVEHVKEEEKKEEEPLPKRERGGRGRAANQGSRSRQQGSAPQSSRSGSQWGGANSAARGGSSQSRSQRAPGMKWTAEEDEEESEVRAGEGDSEFSAEEEGSGESGREGRGGRSAQTRAEGETETPTAERNMATQDSKRVQGREGFAPRGEPSRRGRGGGAGFRTRGNIGRRIDRYGPPPSACPFGQPRDEGPTVESMEEQVDEKDKGKNSRGGQPPGPVGSGKDAASNRAGKSAQGSSTIPPRMQRRGESERSRKSRGGRGSSSGESGTHRGSDGGRKHVTGPESRQGSSDVAEWETTSENSDAEDSGRERREGKRGKGQRGWSSSGGDGVTAPGTSSGPAVGSGITPTSRAPGAEKKSGSTSGGPAGSGQRTSPAPASRGKSSGKGKEEGGNADGSRRGGGVISGGQARSSHTPLMGVNIDISGEKAMDGMDMGTYSTGVAPADDRHPGAEDQGDPPFPFDADGTGFREVRGRRGGGRIGAEENSIGPPPRQQQQPSQRQQRREGPRGEGRGGKGGGKGQAPVGVGRSSGGAPRTGTPSPGPTNSVSAASGPCRPGSPSSVAGGSFERNRPKLPPRLIKQKETERLQKQQAQQQQQQQGRGGHMGGSFGSAAYHSHHGATSSHLRNDVGEVNHQQHHHPGKMVGSSGVLFSMKESNSGPISSGVNAWDKPLGASSAIGSSSPASSGGVGLGGLGGPGSSVGEERGVENGGDRSGSHAVVSGMSSGGSGHRDSPTGAEVGSGLGNGVAKVSSVQKLAVEKPSSVLLDGTSPPVQTIIFENTNYKSGPPSASAAQVPKFNSHHHHHHHHSHKMQRVLDKGRGNDRKLSDDDDGVSIGYASAKDLGKVGGIDVKADPMQLPLGFAKNSEDNSEMKLDFAFHSELSQLTEEKAHGGGSVKNGSNSGGGGGGGTIGGGMALQRNMHVTSTIGTAAELNYKIAAVKTFWENTPPMPTVLEISEGNDGGAGVVVASSSVAAVTSASPSSSSPSSLAQGVVTATTGFVVDQPSSSVVVVTGEDGSGLNATEVVFSPGTPMQGSNSFGVAPASLGKGDPNSTSSNVCKVKPQQQTAVMSTGPSPIGHPGPLSPPPYNSSSAQATAGHINYQPTIGGTAQFGGMSAIPSPPSVIFNSSQQIPAQGGLYGAFPIDGQVLGGGARSQFPQFPSPYGLSQSIGGTSAFSPQSMYLHQAAPHPQPPPPTAAPDMYPSPISQFRIQAAAAGVGAPYGSSGHHVGGTTPPQAPTAVLISTPPTNSLAAVKPPPSQGQGTGGGQGGGGGGGGAGPQQPPPSQGGPPGAVGSKGAGGHYGGTGTLGSGIPSAPQPSPLYIQYNDQGQAVLNHSFLSAGSQMVQRPGPVQSTVVPPPIQPPTSFYSTSAGGQTGFYQPGSSGLGQAAQLHQTAAAVAAAAASSQFGLAQGFGPSQSAPTPVGLQNFGSQMAAAQQYRSTYLKSGGAGGGSGMGGPSDHLQQGVGGRSQLKSPSANPGSQQQAPPDVLTSAFSSAAQIPSPKARNAKLQSGPGGGQGNQQQQPSPTQSTAHQKFSSYTPVAALVLQQQQNNTVRNQMGSGMGGLMRGGGGTSGTSMNSTAPRYPAPIQRPVAVPSSGGNSGRHRMPQQQQRANNIGKHYFGQDSKSEDGSDSGKVPVDGGKVVNGRNGESGTVPTAPSPGPNPTTGQPSAPSSSSPTNPSANSDSQADVGPSLEEQGPSPSAGTE